MIPVRDSAHPSIPGIRRKLISWIINDTVALKMFWCENPDFAKLFIPLSDNERSSYVLQQLRKIKL